MKPFRKGQKAFTLIEVLVSTVIVALLLVILLSVTNQVNTMWRYTSGRTEQFRQAREAFDAICRRVSQATLNTYWDYDDPNSPSSYIRQSELRFISGPTESLSTTSAAGKRWPTHGIFFQAPLGASEPGQTDLSGLNSLLNTWGYFVEFGDDTDFRPGILGGSSVKPRNRFRLCQLIQPADELSIYQYTSGKNSANKLNTISYVGTEWFSDSMGKSGAARPVHILANNVIALVILPKLSVQEDPSGTRLASSYAYNSTATDEDHPDINPKNQLPPLAEITMVVLDEASALRLEKGSTMPDLGLDSLFKNASQYTTDLAKLEKTLTDQHLSYRVFSTTVGLKEAKWSKEQ